MKKTVLICAGALFGIWLVLNFGGLTAAQDGAIRFVLGGLFAVMILLRGKAGQGGRRSIGNAAVLVPVAALLGALLAIGGIVFSVRQFEWLGVILVLFACLRLALPPKYSRDIVLALLMLYWIHPLPGQVFGPLQLFMQRVSVRGSEMLLHVANVRVWADGLVLVTGVNTYEVPAWCSGMRTATTVFLLALGLGILKRLRWHECVVVIVAGLVQALALNIVRITATVMFAPKAGRFSGVEFLHDTAGVIVLAGVLLVYLEILLLEEVKRRRASRREMSVERERLISDYAPHWRVALTHWWAILATAALAVLLAGFVYKCRPFHRAEMIKGVVTELREAGYLDDAQRAAEVVRRLVPGDKEWEMDRIRLLLIRGKYQEVLAALEGPADDSPLRVMEKNVLRAYSFMGLKRMEEAAAMVETLPENARRHDPRAAMILAEIALYAGDPGRVAEHIVVASRWPPNVRRIRALYPYLRAYREWRAIVDSDSKLPNTDAASALSATEAYMNLNRTPEAATLALRAMTCWPEDPRVLEPLFFMALKREDSAWEERFAAHLSRSIKVMDDTDALYRLFDKCFELARPDLAWSVYARISELDPTHPGLLMSAVRYGNVWFSFRKQFLGIGASRASDKIDLKDGRAVHLPGSRLKSWEELCERVPLGRELSVGDTVPVRKQFLERALEEFRRRDANGSLSIAMQHEYVKALEIAGDMDGVRNLTGRIAADRPEMTKENQILLSEIYERRGDWQNVYEVLRNYEPSTSGVSLTLLLRLCQAQSNLRVGLAAVHTAREAVRLFPNSTQAAGILAACLNAYDSPEEALFVLSRPRVRNQSELLVLEAELLYRTERFTEMDAFCRATLLPQIRVPGDAEQKLILPPAELSLMWHRVSIRSDDDFACNAETLRKNLPAATSPFFRDMMSLWLECYEETDQRGAVGGEPPSPGGYGEPRRGAGSGDRPRPSSSNLEHEQGIEDEGGEDRTLNIEHPAERDKSNIEVKKTQSAIGNRQSAMDRWLFCGRDRIEKALALNQLTLLLCRQERYAEARDVAGRAVEFFPESSILWRILISLSGVDMDGAPRAMEVIEAARQSCPEDPEIWLAWLVAKTQLAVSGEREVVDRSRPSSSNLDNGQRTTDNGQAGGWSEKTVIRHLSSVVGASAPAFSPAVMTRAGEYFFRGGMRKAAAVAARDAVRRARGLLPAYVLGVKCALAEGDKEWALECAKKATEASVRPLASFSRKIVELKSADGEIDPDNDVIEALTNLRRADPGNALWAQMLGYVRFERGGWEIIHAMYQMTAALEGGATNRIPYIIAAEASRRLGNHERACELLRKGLEQHPDSLAMLNNLVYTLALAPDGIGEAMGLVPRLVAMFEKATPEELEGQGIEGVEVLDTVAVAYLRSGGLDKAERTLGRILGQCEAGKTAWFRARMRQAEISVRRGKPGEACSILREILERSDGIPEEDILAANDLLSKVESLQGKGGKGLDWLWPQEQ